MNTKIGKLFITLHLKFEASDIEVLLKMFKYNICVLSGKSTKISGSFTQPVFIKLFLSTKLGQGYIFTGVCHSDNRGVPGPGGAWSRGGVCSGGCLLLGGDAWWRPPGRPPLRAVRILLECILFPVLAVNCSNWQPWCLHVHSSLFCFCFYVKQV